MGKPKVTVLLTQPTTDLVMTEAAWGRLRALAELEVAVGSPEDWDLPRLLEGSVACLTGWGTPSLRRELLDQLPSLRLVAHTAGSIRLLVPAEVVGTRLLVSQAAAVIARSVAEMVVLQILCSTRQLPALDRDVRAGQWRRSAGRLLGAQRVGVVGASRTGRAVVDLLHAFGAEILIYDPYLTDGGAEELQVRRVPLDRLLTDSAIVTLHAPLLPQTQGMIGRAELALMAAGSVLINSARAGLIDYDALAAELRSGRISAALDVFPDEPLPLDSPWRSMPNVMVSPHDAGHTREGHYRQALAMVGEIERYLRGDDLRYAVAADGAAVLA